MILPILTKSTTITIRPTNKFGSYYKRLRKRETVRYLDKDEGKRSMIPRVSPNSLGEGKESRIQRATKKTTKKKSLAGKQFSAQRDNLKKRTVNNTEIALFIRLFPRNKPLPKNRLSPRNKTITEGYADIYYSYVELPLISEK